MPSKPTDEYPDEADLERIKQWDYSDIRGLLDFIQSIWWMPDWGFQLKGKKVLRLSLHTGGWSGNESLIEAFQNNYVAWSLGWEKTLRGGHFYFKFRPLKKSAAMRSEKAGRG